MFHIAGKHEDQRLLGVREQAIMIFQLFGISIEKILKLLNTKKDISKVHKSAEIKII